LFYVQDFALFDVLVMFCLNTCGTEHIDVLCS
jgi:hypothetical protein